MMNPNLKDYLKSTEQLYLVISIALLLHYPVCGTQPCAPLTPTEDININTASKVFKGSTLYKMSMFTVMKNDPVF